MLQARNTWKASQARVNARQKVLEYKGSYTSDFKSNFCQPCSKNSLMLAKGFIKVCIK